MKTLTLQTQFALVFDAKAGLNPLTGTAFILPISGFNGEIQPKYTHSLQIGFVLNNSKDRFCKAIANQKKPQMQRLQ